jgi:hypothetical protein
MLPVAATRQGRTAPVVDRTDGPRGDRTAAPGCDVRAADWRAGWEIRDDPDVSEAVADDRPPGPYLPNLSAFRLSGRRLRLPDGLESRSVLVVGFGAGHRGLVEAWVARALAGLDGVPVLEVPVFDRSELWRRGVIDGGMIDGIGDLTVLRRTLTVYTDLGTFCAATGIPDRGTVSVLVVDPDGTVRARATGPVDDAAWEVVAGAVAS